jgi:hypothetical protein
MELVTDKQQLNHIHITYYNTIKSHLNYIQILHKTYMTRIICQSLRQTLIINRKTDHKN